MTSEELSARALFKANDPVHYQGGVYTVTARYYRASVDLILYDIIECSGPGKRRTVHHKVVEHALHKPSLHTLGIAQDPTERFVGRAHSRRS